MVWRVGRARLHKGGGATSGDVAGLVVAIGAVSGVNLTLALYRPSQADEASTTEEDTNAAETGVLPECRRLVSADLPASQDPCGLQRATCQAKLSDCRLTLSACDRQRLARLPLRHRFQHGDTNQEAELLATDVVDLALEDYDGVEYAVECRGQICSIDVAWDQTEKTPAGWDALSVVQESERFGDVVTRGEFKTVSRSADGTPLRRRAWVELNLED